MTTVWGMAFERHWEVFVVGAEDYSWRVKDCKRGLELHDMCDGYFNHIDVHNAVS